MFPCEFEIPRIMTIIKFFPAVIGSCFLLCGADADAKVADWFKTIPEQKTVTPVPKDRIKEGANQEEIDRITRDHEADFKRGRRNEVRKTMQLLIKDIQDQADKELTADSLALLEPVTEHEYDLEKARKMLVEILRLTPEEAASVQKLADLEKFSTKIEEEARFQKAKRMLLLYNYEAMEKAIQYLSQKYPDKYKNAESYLSEIKDWKSRVPNVEEWLKSVTPAQTKELQKLAALRFNALVRENPEVNFDDVLVVRRFLVDGNENVRWGDRPANWQGISSMPHHSSFSISDILSFPVKSPDKAAPVLFNHDRWIGDLELDFDAKRIMFTSNEKDKPSGRNWDIYEIDLSKPTELNNISINMPKDTDSSDSCYLPDGRVLFVNSSGMQGVPCVAGGDYVGNVHMMDRKTNKVRRLTLDQDNNWHPCVLPDGRVLFLRWEYTESAHYFSRILMHMNPDGTDQKEYYGSNSYWPNSLFNARPIPNKPGQFVGTVTGHHGTNRVGEMILFDINRGRMETEGAVQKILGAGKPVENITRDALVDGIPEPYFAEPYPLSDKFFLGTSTLVKAGRTMNLVLCDTFDNVVPLTASDFFIYADPIPLKANRKPPVIPDRVKLDSKTATAFITDVNEGRSVKGVPHGEAKYLRVFMSEYSPRNMGSHYAQGVESNWDVKVLYGTTPIEKDGSVVFNIPANQPITVQLLDKDHQSITLMRSWFTAMPGEMLSCIGCHEDQNQAPPAKKTIAAQKKPAELTPWYGPARTISYLNEIQPILDKNCIACHNAESKKQKGIPDLATLDRILIDTTPGWSCGPGSISYLNLHPFVRRNGPEGDYHGLTPTEFHVDTSELYQILKKGHYNVKLNDEEWDRIITWMDMNVPYTGSWEGEHADKMMNRRYELHKQFTTIERDYVTMDDTKYKRTATPIMPEKRADPAPVPTVKGFPFTVDKELETQTIDLGNNVKMNFRKIPAGSFVMGTNAETPAEQPASVVEIKEPFWMGEAEITLEQYKLFDPNHKNNVYDMHYKDQVKPGYDMDKDTQVPVIRVPWVKAMAFCKWLSEKTGKKVTLPSESQWEYAARGGTDTHFYIGNKEADFSTYANLADVSIKQLAVQGIDPQPMHNPSEYYDFVPRDKKYDDGTLHLAPVKKYKPNAFGLYDMIGNVAEWTSSQYVSYPWNEKKAQSDTTDVRTPRVVRGGSWHDRPSRASSTWRWSYPAWRPVYNVGFRVIIQD